MPEQITPEIKKVDPAAPPVEPKANDDPNAPPAPSTETPPEPPKVEKKEEPKKFTKRERLMHAQSKIEKQLEELELEEDKDRPLTVADYEKLQKDKTKETAIELANDIEDEDERDEVIEMLENRIAPSGNPEQDLALARGAVNSLKNEQIAKELARKDQPPAHSSAPSAPGKVEDVFTPTAEEAVFMRHPYNLSKEEIIAARQKAQAKNA